MHTRSWQVSSSNHAGVCTVSARRWHGQVARMLGRWPVFEFGGPVAKRKDLIPRRLRKPPLHLRVAVWERAQTALSPLTERWPSVFQLRQHGYGQDPGTPSCGRAQHHLAKHHPAFQPVCANAAPWIGSHRPSPPRLPPTCMPAALCMEPSDRLQHAPLAGADHRVVGKALCAGMTATATEAGGIACHWSGPIDLRTGKPS